jgi:segregation and condensation protein A
MRDTPPPTLAGYQLRLPAFEGPLDVLLGLIERERLDVSALSLVAVTDGFLEYIGALHDPPPLLLAEFASVAARLLVLKSRALLPRPETVEPEPDVDDLAEQLREYQRAKQAADAFRDLADSGSRSFGRPPATNLLAPKIVLIAPSLAHLRRALLRSMTRARAEPELAVMRRVVSIGEMAGRLREGLARVRSGARFRDLLRAGDREEIVAGFIALLALWRRGEIAVRQERLFGDIHVSTAKRTDAAAGGDA